MSAAGLRLDSSRNGLSEAILAELDSWPDLNRQIFIQSHYRGQSIDQVSKLFGVGLSEVRMILQQCERRLRAALRAFRGSYFESNPSHDVRSPASSRSDYMR